MVLFGIDIQGGNMRTIANICITLACVLLLSGIARSGSVWGYVIDGSNSTPLSGVRVAVQVVNPDSIELPTVSDGSGAYAITGIPPGNQIYVITAYSPGFAGYYFRYDEIGTGDRQADVILQPENPPPGGGGGDSTMISGFVLTELVAGGARNPVPNAEVTLNPGGNKTVTQTDLSGRYSVRVRVGQYALVVSASGYETLSTPGISIGSAGSFVGVTLKKSPNAVSLEEGRGLPRAYALEAAYPNPFNPRTVVGYQLPVASNVNLAVYDLLGHEVGVLVDGPKEAGRHVVTLEGSNLASGIYFYRLYAAPEAGAKGSTPAGGYVQTRRMILLR